MPDARLFGYRRARFGAVLCAMAGFGPSLAIAQTYQPPKDAATRLKTVDESIRCGIEWALSHPGKPLKQ